MRIHSLALTAFGPFPGTVVVDFEPLNAAGLFLLTGPTGAGKTSILDAICFALYGAVPGGRNGAKAFKSDHAAPDAVPSVALDLTVRGRRIRVHRQPGWARPSRRARTGVVEEKAKASIEEYVDGGWRPHSNRVDEVGQLVTALLGMNKDQFCQVVLLPQGEFQTFLSAGAKERHDVLESLFRTHRFQAIERWLVEHRRQLDLECRANEAGLDRLLARVDEVLVGAGAEPIRGSAQAAGAAVDEDTATRLDYSGQAESVRGRLADLTSAAAAARETNVVSSEHAKAAQHALDQGTSLVELQARHQEAQNRWDELRAATPEVRRREREVLLARRAAAFVPLLDLVAQSEQALQRANLAVEAAAAMVRRPGCGDDAGAPPSGFPTADQVAQAADVTERLRRELHGLEALTATQRELGDLLTSMASLDEELTRSRAEEARLVTASAYLPDQIATAQQAFEAAWEAEVRLTVVNDEVTVAEKVLEAAQASSQVTEQLATLEAALLEAREVRADARDELHRVRERRIAGMAAHLARGLEAGSPCPVCGSADHPDPAASTGGQVGLDDEAASEDAVRRADDALGRLELRRERLQAERTAADHLAKGLAVRAAEDAVGEVLRRQHACAALASTVTTREEDLLALRQQRQDLHESLEQVRADLHTRAERRDGQAQAAVRLQDKIEQAVGAGHTLDERRAAVRERLDSATVLEEALRFRTEAVSAHRSATERLDQLIADSVFATVRQVRDAVRSEADIASGEALNRAHSTEHAATEKALADATMQRAAQSPPPDLTMLELTADQAAAEAALATATTGRFEVALARLEALTAELTMLITAWGPLRERRDRADHVASMVSGTARDNTTKTKLSHYVLAARLAQVVAAANLRLGSICGGRYELEHTLQRGVGDKRGGLGLRVLDTYTGVGRDPATLSGGETFYVSLALALGLADLVHNEIGGTELSTLFVDEGFGTLDAETLDEVMDELDALRSGGRSVGLVSHLAELRIRVPAQLSVVRSPEGSHLDDSR